MRAKIISSRPFPTPVRNRTLTTYFTLLRYKVSLSGGGETAAYTYDGDGRAAPLERSVRGNRVKTVVNGTTITYIGNYFEWSNNVGTKYYYAGNVRVAVRVGTVLDYLFSDHLGSTSITADSSGNLVGGMRYTAFGETRYTAGTTPTSFRYTGQRQAEAGLYYYVARMYDPALGRFLSADTVVPGAGGNPILYDRYGYSRDNPIRYTDPTGHIACDDVDGNGKCINYEQIIHRVRKNLEKFVPPDQANEDQMVTVGLCLIVCARLSPDEYNLSIDENGNLDLGRLWKMRQIQQEALHRAQELFPVWTLEDGSGDAFRHAYWTAMMTNEFGKDFALAFSTAHETQFNPNPKPEANFMDLHNNSVGVEIALSSPNASNEQLQLLVMVALNEGRLYVLVKNEIYLSNMVQDGVP